MTADTVLLVSNCCLLPLRHVECGLQSVQVRPLHFSWPIFMLSSPLMFLSLVLYPAVSPGVPFPAENLSRIDWQALVLGSLLFTFQSVCFYLTGSVCSDLQPQFCFQLPVEVYRGCYGLTNQLDRFSNSVDLEDNQKAPLLGSKSNVPARHYHWSAQNEY